MKLKGMKAAITGGGSGIGAGIGLAFAEQGADVAFLDINLDGARQSAEKANALRPAGNFAYSLDVTSIPSIDEAFAEIERRFGRLDIVVCSAGVSIIVPFLECSEQTWDLTLDVNLKGPFLCLQRAVPLMKKAGGGSVICLSSQSGKVGASQYQAYCSSKFGIIGLTQSLALEFAADGIRANAICPGVVVTPMWDKQVVSYGKKRGLAPEEVMPYFKSKIPLGRLGEIEDMANLAVFLASKDSTYITGQALNVAGGQVMF